MNETEQSALQAAAKEIGEDVALVKKAVAAYKTGGKKALMDMLPEIVAEVKDDIPGAKAVLTVGKAGYKTTEFWLVAGLLIANAVLFALNGKTLPFDVNATAGTLIGIYTAVRGMVKKTEAAVTAPPPPAA